MKKDAILIFWVLFFVLTTSPTPDIIAFGDTVPLPSDTFWWSNGWDHRFFGSDRA